jgi:ubiquinone/menaquinone biosynthesis C-methylase UbiE
MVTRVLVWLCGVSPLLRRALWRWWYNKLARQVAAQEWTFMNYGFQPGPEDAALSLAGEDEADRFCIQLYERATRGIDLAGKKVLEVGSGRGGGASYLARYRQPESLLGIDYSREASLFCKSRHAAVQHLAFAVGDAEKLPLPDRAFDVVVNVESSHCYGNIENFFREVARVLQPGGRFLLADLREPLEMEQLRTQLRSTPGLGLLEEENISAGVVRALEADDRRKRRMIETLVPQSIRPLFQEFAGLESGTIHSRLKQGTLIYCRFVVRKAA